MSDNTTFLLLQILNWICALILLYAPVYLAINNSKWWLLLWIIVVFIDFPTFKRGKKNADNN